LKDTFVTHGYNPVAKLEASNGAGFGTVQKISAGNRTANALQTIELSP
jgi:hypothetical protein